MFTESGSAAPPLQFVARSPQWPLRCGLVSRLQHRETVSHMARVTHVTAAADRRGDLLLTDRWEQRRGRHPDHRVASVWCSSIIHSRYLQMHSLRTWRCGGTARRQAHEAPTAEADGHRLQSTRVLRSQLVPRYGHVSRHQEMVSAGTCGRAVPQYWTCAFSGVRWWQR